MKKIFNVVIYSDKNLKDYEIFKNKCDNILSRKLELKIIPADWKNHGKMAGIKRNQRLVEIGNACIIFMENGGENKGLDDLKKKAEKEKLLIRFIKI